MTCSCKNQTCPYCNPGIEAFYQEKVKEAKAEAAYLKTIGVEVYYRDLLDAKDIWYEYCELRAQNQAENLVDAHLPLEIDNPNSWE